MLTKKLISQYKECYYSLRDYPDNSESIDDGLVPILDALNSKEGLCSLFSCNGHLEESKVVRKKKDRGVPYLVIGFGKGKRDDSINLAMNHYDSLPKDIQKTSEITYNKLYLQEGKHLWKMRRVTTIYYHDANIEDSKVYWANLLIEINKLP
jgi:tRNA(Phe) wybutosine-synthesizing methylase Tyw3